MTSKKFTTHDVMESTTRILCAAASSAAGRGFNDFGKEFKELAAAVREAADADEYALKAQSSDAADKSGQ